MISVDRIEAQWEQLRGKIKVQWGQITDGDLDAIAGRREWLVGMLQAKYGYTHAEAEREIERLLRQVSV